MKLKFIATGDSPDNYTFNGETIVATKDDVSDSFDLSSIAYGDRFLGVESSVLYMSPRHIIRDAVRDENGLLSVTLCQKATQGRWQGKDEWIDSNDYDPLESYIEDVEGDQNGSS